MMIERGRKGKGKKSAILIIEEDDIVEIGRASCRERV